MDNQYEALAVLAKSLHDTVKDNEFLRERAAGLLSDGIFQCKAIPTKLVSESGKDLTLSKLTKEHFFSRKRTARKILDLYDRGWSTDRMVCFIMSRCRVHYTTKEENMHLRKYQDGSEHKTWRQQYEAAGIKLVPWVNKTNKYVYIVDGTEYNSKREMAEAMGITIHQVGYRVWSKSEQFKNWTKHEIR